MTDSNNIIGNPWIKPEDYDVCRSIMADGHEMPLTYDKWLALAEKAEELLAQMGYTVTRITINPKEFSAWCKSRDLKIDATARAAFVKEAANRRVKGGS